jgi:peptidylprolyl isomerase
LVDALANWKTDIPIRTGSYLGTPTTNANSRLADTARTLPEITHRVFFEIEIDGQKVGKIVFGLFGKAVPRTVDNFLGLAKCDRGVGKLSGQSLCYKDTVLHRVIPDFFLQGGDFTHGTGVGGESIYGGTFEDESFEVNHNRPYMLTMSNCGERDCNGSQFLITLSKAQWLNGKHVAFGVVLEGKDVAGKVEDVGTYGGKPKSVVKIVDCGEEPLLPEDKETHY